MYPSGSAPARIYGTPKIQKILLYDSFPKLRSIVSSIATFSYNLAHLFLQRYFFFVSQIKNANLSKTFILSYDGTSLFTNIPLEETIDITINLIFNIILI